MEITKNTIKAFSKIDEAIDESFVNLCDKLQNFQLAYNRQEKLLKQFVKIFEYYEWYLAAPSAGDLYDKAVRELNNPLLRCRERKKGGV